MAKGGLYQVDSRLCKECGEFCEHVIEDVLRYPLEFAAIASGQIERPRLVAASDAGGARAGLGKRNGESRIAGKGPTRGDRHDDGHARQRVEAVRRNHQDGPGALLLVSQGWIERDEIDVAALHSSRPTGGRSSQARSSSVMAAGESHCASSSSRVYFGLVCGWTTRRSPSTARPTVAPASR